jgi:hypothetical protein
MIKPLKDRLQNDDRTEDQENNKLCGQVLRGPEIARQVCKRRSIAREMTARQAMEEQLAAVSDATGMKI